VIAFSSKKDYTFNRNDIMLSPISPLPDGEGRGVPGKEAALNVYTVVHIHFTGHGIGKQSAAGISRIIRQESDWQDLPEDPIIIVTATTPAMLSYLPHVKGIIAEQPGLTSHAAVVSRELGIPTILNVHNATHLFQNGQTVIMDCETGKITVGKQVEKT